MTGTEHPTPTLDRPATYQIKVPGLLDASWADWDDKMAIRTEVTVDGSAFTTLTGTIDQAALQGLLRRLYALGLPLISVSYMDPGQTDAPTGE